MTTTPNGARVLPISACPRCHAKTEEEAGALCTPMEDECPMCDRTDDWNEALRLLNRDALAAAPVALEGEPSKNWWCRHCKQAVAGCDVTFDEAHDVRVGGCGSTVIPSTPVPGAALTEDKRRFRGVGELERTGYIPAGSAEERESVPGAVVPRELHLDIVDRGLDRLISALVPSFEYVGVSLRVSQEDHAAIRSALVGARTALHLVKRAQQLLASSPAPAASSIPAAQGDALDGAWEGSLFERGEWSPWQRLSDDAVPYWQHLQASTPQRAKLRTAMNKENPNV